MMLLGRLRRYRLALLVAAAGIGLSAAAARYQAAENQRLLTQRLERILANVAAGIETRLHDYQQVLQGVRGLLLEAGTDRIQSAQLSRYIASIDPGHEYPGARGFGFVRRVPRDGEAAFVRRQRRVLGADYRVRAFGPNEGDRFLIQLVEPLDRNRVALGLDIASEPNRRAAALEAMASGEARLSAPITLVQTTGAAGQAFLLLLPVYDDPVAPASAERRARLLGWAYAPLQLDAVLSHLIDPRDEIDVALDDLGEHGPQTVLPGAARMPDALRAGTDMPVYGRRWRLTLSGGAGFAAQQGLVRPGAVFSAGLAVTLALTALVVLAGASRRRSLQVRAEQAKLAAIVDSSIDAIVGKDLQGRITSWNHGAEVMFGYAAQEALGRTVAELLVPAERLHEEIAVLAKLAAGGVLPDLETQRRHKDGLLIDVWMALAPVRGPDGAVVGVATTVRDITGRKAAEEQVRQANARLEDTVASRTAQLRQLNALLASVLDAATGVAIIATGTDGTITVFNRGAELMLGYRAGDMVGRATPMMFHDPDELAARAAEIGALEGIEVQGMQALVLYPERDGAETREWTYLRRDGSRIVVSLIVNAIRDHQGRIEGYLGVAVDVTDRKALLDSLRRAKEEADAASEAKSNFLANMSHEIRTPMNAVLGMLELVQMTRLDTRQQDYVGKADQAARTLLRLLNDVLDYSKIEAGKLMLDPHPFDIDALMRDLAVILSGNQGGKPVEVMFDMDPRLPARFVGDRLRLQQVLINLAGNALKFTERGSVKVSLELLAPTPEGVRVRFAVSDTGIGIAPEQRERIFDGFTQAEASISRRFGGTGLGLVLCRHLVGLMGGVLELDSMPGVGSRFWFDLTLLEDVGAPVALPRPGLRILVVDDQPEAAQALLRMVSGLGWDGELAGSGAQALERLQAVRDGAPFDVVLLDWRMPGLNGLETAHAIRSHFARPPLVLMVTAHGREMLLGEPAEAAAMPFAEVLTKPVTPQLLGESVMRALTAQQAAPLPSPRRGRLEGMDILLVEDNALNRQVAGELLASEGARVAIARDGREALEYVLAAEVLPDAVLMDMQMPVMDGIEATRRIRAARGRTLPIIAMTANVSPGDRARCLEAGMDDHVGKPIDLEQMVRLLRPSCSAPTGLETGAAGRIERVLARFGNDAAIYLRSLDAFMPEVRGLVRQARTALEQDERAAAGAALHGLKGVAATVGAQALALAAEELERASKTAGDRTPLLAALDGLTGQAQQEVQALQRAVQSSVRTDAPPAGAALGPDDLAALAELLAGANLRALDVAERMAQQAGAGPLQQRLVEQIRMLDFTAAAVTLAEWMAPVQ